MEMNQVRYFLAICEHRNFTNAARASNVAQPSLTTAIRRLEAELGGPLFLRDRSGCRLTPLGDLMRPRLERLHAEALAAKSEALRHVRLDRVPISIGLGETIGPARIATALARFRSRMPRADVEMVVMSADESLDALREGRLDIAVAVAPAASPELYRADLLYEEGYRVVMAAAHPLADAAFVPFAALATVDLLDRLNCEMREALYSTYRERGHDLYAAYRSNRLDWLLHLARAGAGVVVLPETAVPDDPRLIARPIGEVDLRRQVQALRYRHQPVRPEADALVREMAKATAVEGPA